MKKHDIHYEESDFFDTRKDIKKERKRVTQKDRSKYKKTDQNKLQKPVVSEEFFLKGIVTLIISEKIIVQIDSEEYTCTLKGSLKQERTKKKNLVTIGDQVLFTPMEQNTGVIFAIEERSSILSRAETISQKKEQLIAANVHQVIISVSVMEPILRPTIIDRYLIAAEKGHLHPLIICNKVDLLEDPSFPESVREEQRALLNACLSIYPSIGIPFIPMSIKTLEGIEELKKHMQETISVFSGQSGTGKTSIINEIAGSSFKTQQIVARTKKGSHTTTQSRLIHIGGSGFCVDTPGIKSFGLWQLEKEELRFFFPEFQEASKQCKYPNCLHHHEPECEVQKAIEEGKISLIRYASYINILEELQTQHRKR